MQTLVLLLAASILLTESASAQSTRASEPQAATAAGMARRLPEVRITGVPLENAIDFIRDLTGLNIHVNWRALELHNVTRQSPVTLRLADVTVRRILRALLDETEAGDQLTWYIDDGVVEITTKEISDSKLITRVYPVEDLVVHIPDFAGPTFNLQNQGNSTSGQGGGGSSGGTLFQDSGTNETQDTPQSKAQRADSLVKLITDTVRPDVWRENGGPASVRYFNGHLIVTAPRSIHEALSTR